MTSKLLDALDAVDDAITVAEQKADAGTLTIADIQTIIELVEDQGEIVHQLLGLPYATHHQRVFTDKMWNAPQWSPARPKEPIVSPKAPRLGVVRKARK